MQSATFFRVWRIAELRSVIALQARIIVCIPASGDPRPWFIPVIVPLLQYRPSRRVKTLKPETRTKT